MIPKCKGKFWLESPRDLFCSFKVIPMSGMSEEEQLNAITRLFFVLWIIIALIDLKTSFIFLSLSIIFIIILYYLQRKKMAEKFCMSPNVAEISVNNRPLKQVPVSLAPFIPKQEKLQVEQPEKYTFCNNSVKINYNNDFKSSNQRLVGVPTHKTRKEVPVIPPIYAFDYWCPDTHVPNVINDQTTQELYQNGYAPSNCCDYTENKYLTPRNKENFSQKKGDVRENYGQQRENRFREARNTFEPKQYYDPTDSLSQVLVDVKGGIADAQSLRDDVQEIRNATLIDIPQTYNYPYKGSLGPKRNSDDYYLGPSFPGDINTISTYEPNQLLESNIPSNQMSGMCEGKPEFREYNRNLYTQTIEPGIYSRNNIIEPVSSNIGISFDQQFEPTTCERSKYGKTYTQHDPRIVKLSDTINLPVEIQNPDVSNVYDPRFYGEGTSYRSYIDQMTGQPRFYYDDVNSVKNPNYIIRSNVDHLPAFDSYGSVRPKDVPSNQYPHSLAMDAFTRNTTDFRSDLQERLMRKRNAEMWQLRKYPLRRDMGSTNMKMRA